MNWVSELWLIKGEKEGKKRDFSRLELKPDRANQPLWACADGRIFLETFSPLDKQAWEILITIAEPICRYVLRVLGTIFLSTCLEIFDHSHTWLWYMVHRPENMHEYNLTPHSLYAEVSVGLETDTIVAVLNKLSKTKLPKEMIDFIYASTANYGKVKLVLKKNRYLVESPYPEARWFCLLHFFMLCWMETCVANAWYWYKDICRYWNNFSRMKL